MQKNLRFFALASCIEGTAAFIWLASIPTSGGTFSPVRLILLLGILLVSLGCLAVFISAGSENRFTTRAVQIANGMAGIFISFLLLVISISALIAFLYKDQLLLVMDEAVYARLLPILILGGLLSLQTGMLFLIPHVTQDSWRNTLSPVWKPALTLLGCFLAVWGFMSITRLGFIFDDVGLSWGPPGTPLTFAQVCTVFMVGALLALAYGIFRYRIRVQQLPIMDVVIFIAFWGLAVILWRSEPVSETHFNPPLAEPNWEYYPNSDAMIFDRSSYHLIFGTGFSNQLIRRPLYVGMLALFHELGGFGYEDTIFLQILILALIPPLTYLLTSRLSNRLAGLIAGGLVLLREKNSIELSGRIVTANTKLMMSDMAAMLGVIAFIYAATKLLSQKDRSIWLLGLAGASLGLTALVRAQVFILIPPLLLFLFLEKRPFKVRMKESLLVVTGMVLVILPWVWRNWNLTGTFVLDDRGEEKLLARNYSEIPVGFPEFLPGETEKEYSARIKREIFAYILEHPSDVASFVSNHFFRNLATSAVYTAPLHSTDSPRGLVDQTGFWDEWQGGLNRSSVFPLFVTLALVAFGIGIAQARERLAGWFPFVAFLFYSAGNALVRSSGWRFSMPADWIVLVYYSIALAYLPSRIRFTFDSAHEESEKPSAPRRYAIEAVVFCLMILLGAAVPIAERLVPARDLSTLPEEATKILSSQGVVSRSELDAFLQQENAVFYSGIALYPRYIPLDSRVYLAYTPEEYPFLHFWLINDGDHQIVLPLLQSPGSFPHTATVSIIGCQENNYIATWAVIEHAPQSKVILLEPRLPLSCPLPVPVQN